MAILDTIKYRKTEVAVLLILVFELCFPHVTYAAPAPEYGNNSLIVPNFTIKADDELGPDSGLEMTYVAPIRQYRVAKTYRLPVSAYTSTVNQCDSTPCITANGFDLCVHNQEDVIAANFLPFGAKVRIPKYFGDRIFTVVDRMNERYYYQADIWMRDIEAAINFGVHYTDVEILE